MCTDLMWVWIHETHEKLPRIIGINGWHVKAMFSADYHCWLLLYKYIWIIEREQKGVRICSTSFNYITSVQPLTKVSSSTPQDRPSGCRHAAAWACAVCYSRPRSPSSACCFRSGSSVGRRRVESGSRRCRR